MVTYGVWRTSGEQTTHSEAPCESSMKATRSVPPVGNSGLAPPTSGSHKLNLFCLSKNLRYRTQIGFCLDIVLVLLTCAKLSFWLMPSCNAAAATGDTANGLQSPPLPGSGAQITNPLGGEVNLPASLPHTKLSGDDSTRLAKLAVAQPTATTIAGIGAKRKQQLPVVGGGGGGGLGDVGGAGDNQERAMKADLVKKLRHKAKKIRKKAKKKWHKMKHKKVHETGKMIHEVAHG